MNQISRAYELTGRAMRSLASAYDSVERLTHALHEISLLPRDELPRDVQENIDKISGMIDQDQTGSYKQRLDSMSSDLRQELCTAIMDLNSLVTGLWYKAED
ncbi:MAG: hypothetical protein P9M14_03415 [Candidatus Alcyoniella australis]|nr:hypothetical protein [Candidatus Alcyoniella australis]